MATMTAFGSGASATSADIGTPSTITSLGRTVMRRSSSSLRSASSLARRHAPLLLIASLCIVAGAPSCVGPQQEHTAGRQTTATDHANSGIGDLALAGLATQLADGLVHQAHAMGAAVRQLPAVRVERQQAVAGDVLAAIEEILGLADAAESQRLDPGQAVHGEPVVEFGNVDILGPQRGARPHVR